MTRPTHVTVTAPPGRLTPIHEGDGRRPGGAQLLVAPGMIERVKLSQHTMRSITRGDLVLCTMDGKTVASYELAAAPVPLDTIPAPAPIKPAGGAS